MEGFHVGYPLVVLVIVVILCGLGAFAWLTSKRLVMASRRARGDLSRSAPASDRPLRSTLESVRAGQGG